MCAKENFLLGSALAIPVFSWTIVGFLERVTGWLYHLTVWEIVRLFGYAIVAALVETVLLTLLVSATVTVLIRGRFRRLRFNIAMNLGFLGAAVAASFHFLADLIKASPSLLVAFCAASLTVTVLGCSIAANSPRLTRALRAFADRSRVLVYCIYLPLSVFGILVLAVGAFKG